MVKIGGRYLTIPHIVLRWWICFFLKQVLGITHSKCIYLLNYLILVVLGIEKDWNIVSPLRPVWGCTAWRVSGARIILCHPPHWFFFLFQTSIWGLQHSNPLNSFLSRDQFCSVSCSSPCNGFSFVNAICRTVLI